MEVIGWLGSACFALCALPQVVQTVKQKHADGFTHGLFWLWVFGELFTIAYVWLDKYSLPLLVNYSFNIAMLCIIGYYKYILPRLRSSRNERKGLEGSLSGPDLAD